MHIVNKAKDLLKKFQSGNLSLSDFKELVSTVNDSSDQELEDVLFEEWNKFDTYPSLSQEKIDSLYSHLHKKMKISPFYKITRHWGQIAASILFLFASGLTILYYIHKTTGYQRRTVRPRFQYLYGCAHSAFQQIPLLYAGRSFV